MTNDGIRLDPPAGPHLELERVATDVDSRIANLITALAHDEGPTAATARWALLSLQRARANHQAIEAISSDPMVLALCRAGLETAPE